MDRHWPAYHQSAVNAYSHYISKLVSQARITMADRVCAKTPDPPGNESAREKVLDLPAKRFSALPLKNKNSLICLRPRQPALLTLTGVEFY